MQKRFLVVDVARLNCASGVGLGSDIRIWLCLYALSLVEVFIAVDELSFKFKFKQGKHFYFFQIIKNNFTFFPPFH